MRRLCRVRVDLATVWSAPDAPRSVDAPATADEPDLVAWTSALDLDARRGLVGRTETQLLRGEPVDIVEAGPPGWVRVVAPWQPSPKDVRGYPGWVRSSHLSSQAQDSSRPAAAPAAVNADPLAVIERARRFLGAQYLWGGLSRYGLDCSGLVHLANREAGVVVPRDADAQHAAARPVVLGDEQPGDLYFFARADGHVFHVGFVTGRLLMLHAPQSGEQVQEGPVSDARLTTLIGAGRLGDPPAA
jgi:cell wall-associated NlpC family hydrolase